VCTPHGRTELRRDIEHSSKEIRWQIRHCHQPAVSKTARFPSQPQIYRHYIKGNVTSKQGEVVATITVLRKFSVLRQKQFLGYRCLSPL
jgi:hypothetical protein